MDIKYVISRKHCNDRNTYDFISSLAHEFEDEKDVIGYLDLNNALHYDTEENATKILISQPEWVRNNHEVIAFEKSVMGCYLIRQ